jgi:Tat protein secretion system quality control protein TatD with DNase activity
VAEVIAALRGTAVETVGEASRANFEKLFNP